MNDKYVMISLLLQYIFNNPTTNNLQSICINCRKIVNEPADIVRSQSINCSGRVIVTDVAF